MVEEEKFFAWLDGELAPEEAARVEAAVAADPELSATGRRASRNGRGAARRIRRASKSQPVPERLQRPPESRS